MSEEQKTGLVGLPVIVQVLEARNLGNADTFSESDPFCKVALLTSSGTQKVAPNSVEIRTPVIDDDLNPQWYLTNWVAQKAEPRQFIAISLWDEDATTDDELGGTKLAVESIVPDTVITLKIPFAEKKSHMQELDVRFVTQMPNPKKRVIVVRHSMSEWNQAQSKMDLLEMMKRTDHPLTAEGAAQSLRLAEKIKKAQAARAESADAVDAPTADFLDADKIYVSPLCRATQTAVLGLHPLGAGEKRVWKFRKNLREKKNFGGKDSSGTCFGDDFMPFLVKEMLDLQKRYEADRATPGSPVCKDVEFPPTEVLAQILERVDKCETTTKFWTDSSEDKEEASSRIGDLFFQQLMWDPSPVIICVGHSHYFREFFASYFSTRLREKIEAGEVAHLKDYDLEKMFKWKLENCGAACVDMDMSRIIESWLAGKPAGDEEYRCIEDVHFLFGTGLIA